MRNLTVNKPQKPKTITQCENRAMLAPNLPLKNCSKLWFINYFTNSQKSVGVFYLLSKDEADIIMCGFFLCN